MYGVRIETPQPRRLMDIIGQARAMVVGMDPPASFREALSVYRQMRAGGYVIVRCRFENS